VLNIRNVNIATPMVASLRAARYLWLTPMSELVLHIDTETSRRVATYLWLTPMPELVLTIDTETSRRVARYLWLTPTPELVLSIERNTNIVAPMKPIVQRIYPPSREGKKFCWDDNDAGSRCG
jgi:hypothetical protein